MPRRVIPMLFLAVWSLLAVAFAIVLIAPGIAWWLSLAMLLWFAIWEAHGVNSRRKGDTLSEVIWRVLYVKDGRPVNLALFPLVCGVFLGFASLFVGLAAGADDRTMPGWATIAAAAFVATGTLGFLARHFWTGSNR